MAKGKERKPNGNPNWKKGVSANPSTQFKPGNNLGATKNKRKLPKLEELFANVLGEEVADGITAAEIILKAQRAKAARGDTKAATFLFEHAYGKPKQFIEQLNKNEIDLRLLSEEELFLIEKIQAKINDSKEGQIIKIDQVSQAEVIPPTQEIVIPTQDGVSNTDTVS
jgi:hypothetical protein